MKNLPSRLALECGFYGLDCQEVLVCAARTVMPGNSRTI
jgi:hypothetical protein